MTDSSREYMSSRLHTFGYDGPVIPWSTFGEHLEFLADVGHTPNLAWFVGHNAIRLAAGVSGHHPSEAELEVMEGFLREAMEAGALGMSTGLEFNPGREATTAELVRLNAVAGEYDGIYTSHVRNRDSGILDAIDEFLEVARAGGARAEISHLNVRHNTGAPDRGWERAVELMAAAREQGMDVLADTTPFREGLGQLSGILPPWVAADGPEAALARLRDPEIAAPAADRVRPLLALRPQGRVGPGAPPGERPASRVGRALVRADRRAAEGRPLGLLLRRPRRCGNRVRERPGRGDALHRRAPRRDDLAPALLPRRRHLHGHARRARWPTSCAIRWATRGTSTTSRTTSARTARCASRRRSGR